MSMTAPPTTAPQREGVADTISPHAPGPRLAVLTAAARPVCRGVLRTPGFALAALAGVPIPLTVLRGGTDLGGAVVAAALIAGAAAGGCVEDAAGSTLAASPTTRLARRELRLALIAAVVAVTLALDAVAARVADVPIGQIGPLVAVCAASSGLALMTASYLARASGTDGGTGAGIGGSVVAVMLMLTSSSMAMQYSRLPSVVPGSEGSWWTVAALAWAVAAWLNRDPAARRPHLLRSRR
jgi:hypothetical protein